MIPFFPQCSYVCAYLGITVHVQPSQLGCSPGMGSTHKSTPRIDFWQAGYLFIFASRKHGWYLFVALESGRMNLSKGNMSMDAVHQDRGSMVSFPKRHEEICLLFVLLARIASKIIQGYLCTPVESLCEVSIADVVSVLSCRLGYEAYQRVVLCSREGDVYWDVHTVFVWVREHVNMVFSATNTA